MNFAGLQRIGYKTTLGGSYTYLTGKIGANSFLQQESVEERTASDSLDKELRFNAELVLYDRSNYDQLYVLMDNDTEVYFIFEFPNRQVETLSTKIIVEDRINLSARSRSYLLLRFRFWIYVGAGGFNTGTEPFSPPPFVDPDPFDDFDDGLFYWINDLGDDDKYVVASDIDTINGIVNNHSWKFPTDSELSGINDVVGVMSSVNKLGNGNVLAHASGSTAGAYWTGLWLFDKDLQLIRFKKLDKSGETSTMDIPKVFIDYDDSIYVGHKTSEKALHIIKISSDLFIEEWETTTAPDQNHIFAGGNVTKNFVVIGYHDTVGGSGFMRFYNKGTGELFDEIDSGDGYQTLNKVNFLVVENLFDGKFVIGERERLSFWTSQGSFIEKLDIVDFDLAEIRHISANQDLTFLLTGSPDRAFTLFGYGSGGGFTVSGNVEFYWEIQDTDVTAALRTGEYISKFGWTTDTNRLLFMGRNPNDDTASIYEVILDQQEINEIGNFGEDVGGSVPSYLAFGMKSENWQVQAPAEFPPIIGPPPGPEPPPEPPPEPETPEYFGSIEITSPSASATPAIRPSAVTTLQNNPSSSSDDCGGAGANKTEVSYKGSDYCWQMLATVNKSVNATILVNHINSNVPGLRATNQGGFNPRILLEGNPGVADNNESVVFLVPVAIEGNGAIFSPTTVNLTGGKDSESVNEPVQIFIGGLLFATSANVTDEEPAEDIAIKIFNALDGVSQSNYTFTRNGAKITVESNRGQAETINLVSNAGFSFLTENIDIVA